MTAFPHADQDATALTVHERVAMALPEASTEDVDDAVAFIDRVDAEMTGRYCGSLADKLSNTLSALVAARSGGDDPSEVHLETGTLFGGSLLGKLWALDRAGRARQRVICIDPLDGYYGETIDPWSGLAVTAEAVLDNVARFGFDPARVTLVKKPSTDPACLDPLEGATLRTLLIDGDHAYEGASFDWRTYAPRVGVGGLAVLDDYGNRAWPGVTRFGRELVDDTPAGWRVRGAIDTGLVLERVG